MLWHQHHRGVPLPDLQLEDLVLLACLHTLPTVPLPLTLPLTPHPLLNPSQVSSVYQRVPYHNFQHCVDVTHTTFMFIK